MTKAVSKFKSVPAPHIVLRLQDGWQYENTTRRFTKGKDLSFTPKDLPKQIRILPQVPALAKKVNRSEAEDELARGFQIVHPKDTSANELLNAIRKWPCVEKAWIAPTPVSAAAPDTGSIKGREARVVSPKKPASAEKKFKQMR